MHDARHGRSVAPPLLAGLVGAALLVWLAAGPWTGAAAGREAALPSQPALLVTLAAEALAESGDAQAARESLAGLAPRALDDLLAQMTASAQGTERARLEALREILALPEATLDARALLGDAVVRAGLGLTVALLTAAVVLGAWPSRPARPAAAAATDGGQEAGQSVCVAGAAQEAAPDLAAQVAAAQGEANQDLPAVPEGAAAPPIAVQNVATGEALPADAPATATHPATWQAQPATSSPGQPGSDQPAAAEAKPPEADHAPAEEEQAQEATGIEAGLLADLFGADVEDAAVRSLLTRDLMDVDAEELCRELQELAAALAERG